MSGFASSRRPSRGAICSARRPLPIVGWALEPILLVVLGVATVTDLLSRTIPNRVSLGGALAMSVVTLQAAGPGAAAGALAGGALSCLPLAAVHCLRPGAMGGGDVKLAFAIGCCVGPAGLLAVILASTGALAGAIALIPLRGAEVLSSAVPFAPWLAAGAVAVLWVS